ncbi:hypothetical protein B0H19DRAFT_1256094 [Mycena capillaripes]|nr:hypothetical protein B0H19DRAFT_1256094 [Mycena capillaripes]
MEEEYYESIEDYKRASWWNPVDKLNKKTESQQVNVFRLRHIINLRLGGSPPGSTDDIQEWADRVARDLDGDEEGFEIANTNPVESQQKDRDALRNAYMRLKDTLPPTNQKFTRISLLDRATNHVRHLENRLREAELQVEELRLLKRFFGYFVPSGVERDSSNFFQGA